MPILEPEVSIKSPHKEEAEALLVDAIQTNVDALPADAAIMLKLTIPSQPGSSPSSRPTRACFGCWPCPAATAVTRPASVLAADPSMIASFSRALLQGLSDGQSDAEFNATLDEAVSAIYDASVNKTAAA